MRNEHVITMDEQGHNELLEDAILTLEMYEQQPIEEFERLFAHAKIEKKHIRMHLEFMKSMRERIITEMDELIEDDYIFVHKQSLIDAFNGKPPKWLTSLGFE